MDTALADLELDEGNQADKDEQDNTRGARLARFSVAESIIVDIIDQRIGRVYRTSSRIVGEIMGMVILKKTRSFGVSSISAAS